MNTVFLTEEHISKFNDTVGTYMSMGFDIGFEHVIGIVGIAVLIIVLNILITKL